MVCIDVQAHSVKAEESTVVYELDDHVDDSAAVAGQSERSVSEEVDDAEFCLVSAIGLKGLLYVFQ